MITKTTSKRLHNLLNGKIDANTKISVGYTTKNNVDFKEGDIWEENNKKWTIKNGIKQNITKLDNARKLMPFTCPKCNKLMKGHFDKQAYIAKGVCLDCMVEEDTKLIIAGKFEEKENQEIKKNVGIFINDLKVAAEEYIEQSTKTEYVSEQGDIEHWSVGHTKDEFKKILNTQIDAIEQTNN